MSYLIDTNIISELRKGAWCDASVLAWYASVGDDDLYLSTLVLGEIRKGVEISRTRDPAKAARLGRWLLEVEAAFGGRVLGVDAAVTDRWGRISAIRPVPVVDSLLAADTTTTHGQPMFTVLGGLDERERDLIGARTVEGLAGAAARGVKMGRKPKLTSDQRWKALRRKESGDAVRKIARSYNVHNSTISRLGT